MILAFLELSAHRLLLLILSVILITGMTCVVPIYGIKDDNFAKRSVNSPKPSRNPKLSTPEECDRVCVKGEPPKTCYYHFTLEIYNVLGGACELCTPNATNAGDCQCVLADGYEKEFLSANRMLPGPSIRCCENDKVYVDVTNKMEGMENTIHWHGILQRGTPYYDGVPLLTQCAIPHGTTFRYVWYANSGTHFWHAHTGVQKQDGLYGSIIVLQPLEDDPNSCQYDYDLEEHVMLISDWFHWFAIEKFPGRLHNNTSQDPDNLLINGKGQYTDPLTRNTTDVPLEIFNVTQGKRYRFRMINSFATVCPAQLTIQNHSMTLIACDGEPIKPRAITTLISFSGETYDFVINANRTIGAYWIQLKGLGECGIGRIQQLAILRYESGPSEPSTPAPTYDNFLRRGDQVLGPITGICDETKPHAICVDQLKNANKVDKALLQEVPDVKIFLPFRFFLYKPDTLFIPGTYNRYLLARDAYVISLIDNITYVAPPSPPLSQIDDIPPELFCNGDNRPANCSNPCMCSHQIDIPLYAIVEVILVDEVQVLNLSHPFHLHGYSFNVLGMGQSPDKDVDKISVEHCMDLDRRGKLKRCMDSPPLKKTIAVPHNGYVVFRFRADNPGYWLLHCHFLYHLLIGMELVFHVGTQADLPPVPTNFPKCGNFLPAFTEAGEMYDGY